MRDKDLKKRAALTIPQAGEANTSTVLDETQLNEVAGGKVSMQDFHFTMKMNKASPG